MCTASAAAAAAAATAGPWVPTTALEAVLLLPGPTACTFVDRTRCVGWFSRTETPDGSVPILGRLEPPAHSTLAAWHLWNDVLPTVASESDAAAAVAEHVPSVDRLYRGRFVARDLWTWAARQGSVESRINAAVARIALARGGNDCEQAYEELYKVAHHHPMPTSDGRPRSEWRLLVAAAIFNVAACLWHGHTPKLGSARLVDPSVAAMAWRNLARMGFAPAQLACDQLRLAGFHMPPNDVDPPTGIAACARSIGHIGHTAGCVKREQTCCDHLLAAIETAWSRGTAPSRETTWLEALAVLGCGEAAFRMARVAARFTDIAGPSEWFHQLSFRDRPSANVWMERARLLGNASALKWVARQTACLAVPPSAERKDELTTAQAQALLVGRQDGDTLVRQAFLDDLAHPSLSTLHAMSVDGAAESLAVRFALGTCTPETSLRPWTRSNWPRATDLWLGAALRGSARAMRHLGCTALTRGRLLGWPLNVRRAVRCEWLLLAAERGDVLADVLLLCMPAKLRPAYTRVMLQRADMDATALSKVVAGLANVAASPATDGFDRADGLGLDTSAAGAAASSSTSTAAAGKVLVPFPGPVPWSDRTVYTQGDAWVANEIRAAFGYGVARRRSNLRLYTSHTDGDGARCRALAWLVGVDAIVLRDDGDISELHAHMYAAQVARGTREPSPAEYDRVMGRAFSPPDTPCGMQQLVGHLRELVSPGCAHPPRRPLDHPGCDFYTRHALAVSYCASTLGVRMHWSGSVGDGSLRTQWAEALHHGPHTPTVGCLDHVAEADHASFIRKLVLSGDARASKEVLEHTEEYCGPDVILPAIHTLLRSTRAIDPSEWPPLGNLGALVSEIEKDATRQNRRAPIRRFHTDTWAFATREHADTLVRFVHVARPEHLVVKRDHPDSPSLFESPPLDAIFATPGLRHVECHGLPVQRGPARDRRVFACSRVTLANCMPLRARLISTLRAPMLHGARPSLLSVSLVDTLLTLPLARALAACPSLTHLKIVSKTIKVLQPLCKLFEKLAAPLVTLELSAILLTDGAVGVTRHMAEYAQSPRCAIERLVLHGLQQDAALHRQSEASMHADLECMLAIQHMRELRHLHAYVNMSHWDAVRLPRLVSAVVCTAVGTRAFATGSMHALAQCGGGLLSVRIRHTCTCRSYCRCCDTFAAIVRANPRLHTLHLQLKQLKSSGAPAVSAKELESALAEHSHVATLSAWSALDAVLTPRVRARLASNLVAFRRSQCAWLGVSLCVAAVRACGFDMHVLANSMADLCAPVRAALALDPGRGRPPVPDTLMALDPLTWDYSAGSQAVRVFPLPSECEAERAFWEPHAASQRTDVSATHWWRRVVSTPPLDLAIASLNSTHH